jgi:UDP-2,4-diacetamido-2,4,6-trideoxy-beta-L-altropyranose hydrolase
MGTGHLRRCLSLAQTMIALGAKVEVLTRRLDTVSPHILCGPATPDGLDVNWLPVPSGAWTFDENGCPHQAWAGVRWTQDVEEVVAALLVDPPEWIVIDHYAFDERWHAAVRDALGCRILVIDDTADRMLDCDALLDQNWDPNHNAKYTGKLRRGPIFLVGPRFALLDNAFLNTPRYSFNNEVRSLGVFMGGTDPGGVSEKVLDACRQTGFSGLIEVVTLSSNPHLLPLQRACFDSPNTLLTLDESNLAKFFTRHDLQVGAGGSATWERCFMGVPFIAMITAENQRHVLEPLHNMGILQIAEEWGEDLVRQIHALVFNPEARALMSERSRLLVDGNGAVRAAKFLIDAC